MTAVFRLLLAAALLAPLPACTLFGGGEEEEVPETAAVEAEPILRPVESIRGIEIGRTRDGIVVTAYGIAPAIGYAAPQLRPRRGGRIGEDGYLDFDFLAVAPDRGFALPKGEPTARILRADRLLGLEIARAAQGLRIHSASGGQQVDF